MINGTRAFQACSNLDRATAATPRAAAEAFFEKFPKRRKCDVVEGTHDGECFTLVVRLNSGQRATSYKDVTKKTLADLPAV